MKKKPNSLTWPVMYYSCNANKIEYYDILKCREEFIKKLKKKCTTKEEFAERMRTEFMRRFLSKCEWELIVEIDENNRVWLYPWAGCREPEKVCIDVTDREDFDWKGFAELHVGKQIYKNRAKIDVFDQLKWQWTELIDYCWCTRLKYERDHPKFHCDLTQD